MELVVSFEIDGLHHWPGAPERFKEFKQLHRHLFKFVCFYPVKEVDREVELWELRSSTISWVYDAFSTCEGGVTDFGSLSCEAIAQQCKRDMGFSKVFVGEEYWLGAIV